MLYEEYWYKVPESDLLSLLKMKQHYLHITNTSQNSSDADYIMNFNPHIEIKRYERHGNEYRDSVKIINEEH